VFDAVPDGVEQLRADLVHRRVLLAAVGALGDDEVERPRCAVERLRVGEDRRVVAADVGGKEQPLAAAVLVPLEHDVRRAEDVAGVEERECDAVADFGPLAVLHALPEF
jgi:hypothetical protein